MLHPALDEVVDDLLRVWRRHDDLRRDSGTPYRTLASSRVALDGARAKANRLRLALCPYGNDVDLIATVVICERLDEVVHIPFADLEHRGARQTFTCLCGSVVTREVSRARRATA